MIINKIKHIYIHILLFVLFLSVENLCQDFNYYKIDDGLSQNTVLSIIQDTSGYLWFGTRDGLNRFDGIKFYQYYNKYNNDSSLSHNSVTVLLNDFEGNLWIGTNNGLNKYLSSSNSFKRYYPKIKNNSPFIIKSLFRSGKSLLVGTTAGLWILDINENKFYKTKRKNQNSTDKIEINSIFGIDSLRFLIASDEGLFLFNKKFRLLSKIENIRENDKIISICKADEGNVWVAAEREVFLLSLKDFELVKNRKLDFSKNFNIKNYIRQIYQDSKKNLWISTWSGLFRFKLIENKLISLKRNDKPKGLHNNSINVVFEDKQGIIWVGTSFGGIKYFDRLAKKFTNITHESGISSTIIGGITNQNKNIWFSTIGGGIYKFNPLTKEVTQSFKSPKLLNNITRRIFCDSKNRIWISYWINAVSILDAKNNSIEHFRFASTDKEILNNTITTIFEDKNNTIWLGSKGNEIIAFDSNLNFKKYNSINGKFKGKTVRVFFNYNNKLLCMLDNGIQYYQRNKDKFVAFTANWAKLLKGFILISVYVLDNNRIFFGTYGSGLLEVNVLLNKLTAYSVEDGMPNNLVYGILKDNTGKLWLSTNKGLSSFDIEKKKFRNYFSSDGIQSNEFNDGAYLKDSEGRLFFGGINGITYFNPKKLGTNKYVPKTVITEVDILNRNQKIKFPNYRNKIVLNYYENGISISFASLNYSFPKKNKFKYLIKPSNLDWINIGKKNQIVLTNLEGGKYKVIVKGSNGDNVWDSKGAEINFEILPPFYKTWWFISSVTIFLVLIIGAIIWIKVKEVIRLEKLRLRIASDLHDEIGSSLSKLSMNVGLLEFEKNTEKIKNRISRVQEISKETIGMMSDTVWSIDSRNDSLLDLIDRMSTHLTNMRNDTEIDILFDFEIQSPDKKIPALIRQNIYLIFKEAVNNSIKYSYAKNIKCKLIEKKGYLFLSIKDSGVGFNKNKQSGGNGLRNMKMRADKLKADFKISSENGVTIELSVKIS